MTAEERVVALFDGDVELMLAWLGETSRNEYFIVGANGMEHRAPDGQVTTFFCHCNVPAFGVWPAPPCWLHDS